MSTITGRPVLLQARRLASGGPQAPAGDGPTGGAAWPAARSGPRPRYQVNQAAVNATTQHPRPGPGDQQAADPTGRTG